MVIGQDGNDKSYIRSNALSGFAEFIESRNGDPTLLLEHVGIDPLALDTPDMLVSSKRKGMLLEHAARELGIPALGLEWALNIPAHFPNAGPMLLLDQPTVTFGEWLERSMRYWSIQTNAFVPQLVYGEYPGVTILRTICKWPQAASRQQMEHILGKIACFARAALLDAKWNPAKVRFRHKRPEETDMHDLVFRCQIEFGTRCDELWFDSEILARPICRKAEVLETLVEAFLRQRIGLLPVYVPSLSTSTRLAIQTVLGAGVCSKEFIALVLGYSAQPLQRLLAREGTTYENILDSVRREMACDLLANSTAPIAAIGGMLDFTTDVALTLAMRRWTGMTPRAYRQAMKTVDAGSA